MNKIMIYIYLYLLWFFAISLCLALPALNAALHGVSIKEVFAVFVVCSSLIFFTDLTLVFLCERAAKKGRFEKKNYEANITNIQKILHFLFLGKYTHNF